MTPAQQFAESVKYTARQVVLIPVEGDFVILEAYGTRRTYLNTIPSAELARWAEDDFARQRSCRDAAVKRRPPIVEIALDIIDFEL